MDEIETAGNALVRAQKGGSAALVSREAPNMLDLAVQDRMVAAERFVAGVSSVRDAAVRSTNPKDWVLMGKGGDVRALLTSSGCRKVRPYLGLKFEPADGWKSLEPIKEVDENGVVSYRKRGRARSEFLGGDWMELESSRNEIEGWTGRRVDETGAFILKGGKAYLPDLKSSCDAGWESKVIRALFGMNGLEPTYLDECWKGTWKKSSMCQGGAGFGSSKERSEEASPEDLEALRKKLREAILERCKGDTTAAAQLLYRITKYKGSDGKDYGHRSVEKLDASWKIERALKELANLKEGEE